ncbi:hypothetical protein BDF20DRAFT_984371 [Mycotypha africana]|uniref:uncharacterized protein n=1 Tax=Mycotypha africana TaxID=64632 RepID=UPI0023013C69|nr:uncharacterized protein BDF20DRAFT_984371 [Mycotypha africana]KAI8991761.1 hypothetical protein BDF20DRAFT_984371 [Mycotypha africana]
MCYNTIFLGFKKSQKLQIICDNAIRLVTVRITYHQYEHQTSLWVVLNEQYKPFYITKLELTGQDKALHDLVIAPSSQIDDITKNLIIRDTEYIIEYLKQRINLEQKYVDDVSLLTKNIQNCCVPNEHNLVQQTFMNFVELETENRVYKEQYIQRLKEQRDILMKFRNEQQRLYDKNRAWMNQLNAEYIMTRLDKLPKAYEIYTRKWNEIEALSNTTVSSPMITLSTPIMPNFYSLPVNNNNNNITNTNNTHNSILSVSTFKDENVEQSSSKKIERFMKKHLNKVEDPAKQNLKLAKLKVELNEADTNYRNVVRDINTMALKLDATNYHILLNVQSGLKERSERVKIMLQNVIKADTKQLQKRQQSILTFLENSVYRVDVDKESQSFNKRSIDVLSKLPKPPTIYYRNHHVGICKDLIFGTSLTDYAQLKGISPPLLITKCITAIERLGGMEKEGIYRVSGKHSNLEKIKHAFEMDEEAAQIGHNGVPEDVFSIASIIKIFLRELKTPLFPFKLADRLAYSQIPDQELRLMNLLTRLLKLANANYDTLKALIYHLSKLQACVEKNKMTISNLTLIFTPAIFQDLNNAQNSPGEWAKDCVLEDLINNYQVIFANKDLHNNSAITGAIDYGFEQYRSTKEDGHTNEAHRRNSNRYALPIQSPESVSDITSLHDEQPEYSLVTHEEGEEGENSFNANNDMITGNIQKCDNESHWEDNKMNTEYPQKPAKSLADNTILSKAAKSNLDKKKYQSHFKLKGLRVDTTYTTESKSKRQPEAVDHYIPAVKSAIVPSHDWLSLDPAEHVFRPIPTNLRRSATTGKKALSKRNKAAGIPPSDIPSVPTLNRNIYSSSFDTTTTSNNNPHDTSNTNAGNIVKASLMTIP